MNTGDGRADEAAVINQPAVLDHENFRERLAGEFLPPVGRHVNEPRADDSADHQPQGHVGDFFGGNVFAAGAQRGRPKPGEKRQRNHHAIPMNGERAELKGNRMHGNIEDLD